MLMLMEMGILRSENIPMQELGTFIFYLSGLLLRSSHFSDGAGLSHTNMELTLSLHFSLPLAAVWG